VKFTTLIPLTRNDGSPVSSKELSGFLDRFYRRFGGYTVGTPVRGCWSDADGQRFDDEALPVTVECDNSRLEEARKLVLRIGRQLGQKAMWFEVQYFDGVQILQCE